MAAAEDAEGIAASLRTLCREKCSEMDLKNHRTAYNALKKIGEPIERVYNTWGTVFAFSDLKKFMKTQHHCTISNTLSPGFTTITVCLLLWTIVAPGLVLKGARFG